MSERQWHLTDVELPPDGVEVETKIDDERGCSNVQTMTRAGRLWFAGAMYAYYKPTHWRALAAPDNS